jgi:hypothetical protein
MKRSRWFTRLTLLVALACQLGPVPVLAQDAPAADDPASRAIRVYQQHLSAMRHMHCRFTPSCSQYAIDAIATYGIVEGSARAADRLMRCNASAEGRYPRNSEGLLVDPAGESPGTASSVRVPRWLLLEPEGAEPPTAAALTPERRSRLEETVTFALQLEQRGDCERASGEFQRAGMLADTIAAHAWAYARIAHCYFGASQWYFADRAYLTSAMLTRDDARRASVGYGAAVSRFDAGAFVACTRLLSDSALTVSVANGEAFVPGSGGHANSGEDVALAPGGRVTALTGLCAFALGDWAVAERTLARTAAATPSAATRERVVRLAEAASRGPGLPHRSPGAAGVLSALVPGAGQIYAGHAQDGLRHLVFNAALIYTVASLAQHGQVPASVIVGSVALPFYLGNVLGAQDAARRFNHQQRMRLLERSINESSR